MLTRCYKRLWRGSRRQHPPTAFSFGFLIKKRSPFSIPPMSGFLQPIWKQRQILIKALPLAPPSRLESRSSSQTLQEIQGSSVRDNSRQTLNRSFGYLFAIQGNYVQSSILAVLRSG